MSIVSQTEDSYAVQLDVGKEFKLPPREPFSHFPRFRLLTVVKDRRYSDSRFWPGSQSKPSTRHPKTIRFIQTDWNGAKVKIDYDDTSKVLKFVEGNVDTVIVEVI